ncbi:MAG: 2-succinyl-5-enolpyruvyl-6-hydroxy-3-cyclohexene-1-carboxylic-acid synthase [Ignavibacteria bacterium]
MSAAANLAWADAFVAHLAAAGLRHVVLAPGARSAPLALAALRRPEIACHVVGDERAAGYFALGIGRATRWPAAVLCTSGTAAANLLPAVMEANLGGAPLLLLTADRPTGASGWGANQTADQTRLYGSQVRAFHAAPMPTVPADVHHLRMLAARVLEECRAPVAGPVHVNLPFGEPLLPETIPAAPPLPEAMALVEPAPELPSLAALDALAAKLSGRCGVIVCGELDAAPDFGTALATLAARLGAPVLAEPLSNLRCGPHDRSRILAHQARFLRQPGLPAPDWVLRLGSFPVSRTLERWLAGLDRAHHVLVAPPGRWPDPLHRSDAVLRADAGALAEALAARVMPAPADWCAAWQRAESEAASCAKEVCAADPLFEGSVANQLIDALPAGAHCFVGNSLAIRAVDAFTGTRAKPLQLHGNRGASGIDGNIASAAGIAAAVGAPVALLIGDQTALHDCGSLALLAGRDIVAVVMDNGGGGIFDHLPFAGAVPPPLFARGWTAAPHADFASLAAAFGVAHAMATDGESLRRALETAFAAGGPWLLRAVVDRVSSRERFAA